MSVEKIGVSIINYLKNNNINEGTSSKNYNNFIQLMGSDLENFVENLFLNNADLSSQEKSQELSKIFSYRGSANTPPDLILKNSFAIEIKKKENKSGSIPLNSSYPKNSINNTDVMLSKECSSIDGGVWEKGLFYYIGEIPKDAERVKSLSILDGKCYSADRSVYERIKIQLKKGIQEIENIEFTDTKELGKIKKIDPYKITDLRIRGMWNIEHPSKFLPTKLDGIIENYSFLCVMEYSKYIALPETMKQEIKKLSSVSKQKLEDPNNLSNSFDVIVIVK